MLLDRSGHIVLADFDLSYCQGSTRPSLVNAPAPDAHAQALLAEQEERAAHAAPGRKLSKKASSKKGGRKAKVRFGCAGCLEGRSACGVERKACAS